MSIDEKSKEWGNSAQGNSLPQHNNSTSQPCYEFYRQGITEPHKVWFDVIRNTRGRYLVAVAAVWALYEIACEFLKSGCNHFDDKSFFGTLLVAGMLLTIAIVSLRRTEDTDAGQKENREKDKDESAESGTGGISPGQNRRTTTRNRGSDANGGGK
jgi:hypothetical protein